MGNAIWALSACGGEYGDEASSVSCDNNGGMFQDIYKVPLYSSVPLY
jgi:hypothetical protein